MKASNHISQKERKLLLIVVFAVFVLSVGSFTQQIIETHNSNMAERQEELRRKADNVKSGEIIFGLYEISSTNFRPFYALALSSLSILTFILLLKSKKFIVSTLSASFSFLIFVHWFIATRNAISVSEVADSIQGLDRFFYEASLLDFIIFVFVTILLFWQFSILLRILIKNTQRKNILP